MKKTFVLIALVIIVGIAILVSYQTARIAYVRNDQWNLMVDSNGLAVVSLWDSPEATCPSDLIILGQKDGQIRIAKTINNWQ